MNKIIGRTQEKETLNKAFSSKRAELIAVYGRRRVGKTYLIKNLFQTKKCLFFHTVGIYNGTLKMQLEQFSKEVGLVFYHGANIQTPQTWMEAFEALTQAINKEPLHQKIVLFFDELPWMATRRSNLVNSLEYYWNRYWASKKNVKLIVCGSAASWLITNIIKNKGGLHNRLTQHIRLLPFILKETFEYLKYIQYTCTLHQVAKIYMVTGGVPFYLENFKKNLSIAQNINTLFFNAQGVFFNEFDEIFLSLFENSEQYKEIVSMIAQRKDGVHRSFLEANNKLTGVGGRLTKRLETLEHAGFISGYLPYGHKTRGLSYRIDDAYCYFYYKWILPIKNHLKTNPNVDYWSNIIRTPAYYSWLGYAFENICYKHLLQIRKALCVGSMSLASPWRTIAQKNEQTEGAQIDLLFNRSDDAITICEIKYTETPFAIDKQYAKSLANKIELFVKTTKTKKQVFLAVISASGLKNNTYAEDLITGGCVTLEDLFR